MHLLKRIILFAFLVVAAACAAGPGPAAGAPRSDPDLITEQELARYPSVSVRQAIERLRPRFLRTRGPTSLSNPAADRIVVYLGDTRMGSLEFLDQIMTGDILEVRYLSAPDATQRYGTGHTAGAIVLRPR